jgi:hypothetical protein
MLVPKKTAVRRRETSTKRAAFLLSLTAVDSKSRASGGTTDYIIPLRCTKGKNCGGKKQGLMLRGH